jgi:predicted permease
VAVINESAARLAWPDGDPIGRSFHLGTSFGLGRGRAGGEVVGVVRDVKEYGLDASARPEVFLTNDQFPMDYFSIVVRSPNDPRALIEPIRSQLHALDPEVPMFAVQTMERLVRLSLAQPRFYMLLLAVFATTALALAALGIYGVIAYAVAGRTREIGIRLALGAQRRDVLGMVLRQGLALAGAGLLLGLLGSLGATRLLADLLFGVRPTDAPTFVGVAALLLVVALAATYVPARRAASTDPIDSLRQE